MDKYKSVSEIRILPMSVEIFPEKEDVIAFFRKGMHGGNGHYYYRRHNISYKGEALVLFQYQNQLIASAALIGEDDVPLEDGDFSYSGRYHFDVNSIMVFESPINKEEYALIDPSFNGFSRITRKTDVKYLEPLLELIYKKSRIEKLSFDEAKLRKYLQGYIMYEVATHGVDPRVTMEDTDLRLHDAEGYKYDVFTQSNSSLKKVDSYVDKILEILSGNNLVDHHQIVKVKNKAATSDRKKMEQALQFLYTAADDETAFSKIVDAFGANFDIVAFLFFIKDANKYLPIRSRLFDERFERIGIKSNLSGNCTWNNYVKYIKWIAEVQKYLVRNLNSEMTLLDAHSFVWILPNVEKYMDSGLQLVEHKKYGKGVIVNIEGEYVSVQFGNESTPRKFSKNTIDEYISVIPVELNIYDGEAKPEVNVHRKEEYDFINEPRIKTVEEWKLVLKNELRNNKGFSFVHNVLVEMYKLENYTIFCKEFEETHGYKGLNLRVGEFRDRIKSINGIELHEQLRKDTGTDRAWNIPFETDVELNEVPENRGRFSWKLRKEVVQALENVMPEIIEFREEFEDFNIADRLGDKKIVIVDSTNYFDVIPDRTKKTSSVMKSHPKKVDYVKKQRSNKRIGDFGEEQVKRFEIERLTKAGRTDLANKVKRAESDAIGYDIESFDADGTPKHIEVKTSTTNSQEVSFYITAHEIETLKEDSNYELYYLYGIYSKEIKMIQFSNDELREKILPLYLTPTQYVARIPRNDE